MKWVVFSLVFLISVICVTVNADDVQCTDYNHGTYGKTGHCVETSSCPGNQYQSNKCPNYGNSIKCCWTVKNDAKCYNYGQTGQCMLTSACSSPESTISNYCPNYGNSVKCCYSDHEDDTQCTGYDHTTYGQTGHCVFTSQCPGDEYASGKCPNFGNSIKCCWTAETDAKCDNYYHPLNGTGRCMKTSVCTSASGAYVSGRCPSYGSSVKCCYGYSAIKQDFTPCDDLSAILVSRSGWGADSPTSTTSLTQTPVTHVFIHHTASTACTTKSTCISTVKGIQNYHMNSKGWDDIGYSFLVGQDGNVYEGRGWDREGAHTAGYNDQALAFSFLGDFTSTLPNTAALQAAEIAIACGISNSKIHSNYKLLGHRDVGTTSCPGTKLYNDEVKTWYHYNYTAP